MKELILINLLKLMRECLSTEQKNHPKHGAAIQLIIDPAQALIKTLEKDPPP